MKRLLSSVTNFIREEDGATAIEYSILASLIAAAIVVVVVLVGQQVSAEFQKFLDCMSTKTCS